MVQVHVPPLSTESPPGNRGAFDFPCKSGISSYPNAIGTMGVFLLFGALTVVALGYFCRKVPETKGRSLPEPEQ